MIELTVATPLEAVKDNGKRQRKKREYFSESQVRLLTETLKQNLYLSLEEKKALAVRLQTSVRKVQKWFTAKRYKIRKQKLDVEGNQ